MDSHPDTSTTTLCLACSASLPPRRTHTPSGSSKSGLDDDVFYTPCCGRPICPSCLSSNPRLRRYNPCLHCLGGIGVVGSRSSPQPPPAYQDASAAPPPQNIDGGVHDEDIFVLGDEDDEVDDISSQLPTSIDRKESPLERSCEPSTGPSTPPPPYALESSSAPVFSESTNSLEDAGDSACRENSDPKSSEATSPVKYYIKPGDTLLGISLRYGIDGRLLCRMNDLPPSTLRTTPHLLHTRTFLTLPPTPKALTISSSASHNNLNDAAYEARRTREKADKRLQTLTKETDWRVAKAYVALAEYGDDEQNEPSKGATSEVKPPEKKIVATDPFTGAESSLEARAIDRYLDDDVWEAGRKVLIPRFPLFDTKGKGAVTSSKSWWKMR